MENPIKILTTKGSLPSEESIRFLGVTIDNKLTWSAHINNIITKLSTNEILLGKSKHLMNQDAKRLIYFTHIHSHLTYANTVWSNHITGKHKKKTIEKIQKYCMRIITRSPPNTHTDPLFKSQKIMKFEELRRLEQCNLIYKIKNKLLPKPILELFNSLGKKTHHYNTR